MSNHQEEKKKVGGGGGGGGLVKLGSGGVIRYLQILEIVHEWVCFTEGPFIKSGHIIGSYIL